MTARHQRPCSPLVQFLRDNAPPTPKCFRDRDQWISWLHFADASKEIQVIKLEGRSGKGEANRGRIKTTQINDQIDYCQDCTKQRQEQMQDEDRCFPPDFAQHPSKEMQDDDIAI